MHYIRLLVLSLVLLAAVSFHKIFRVMPHPVSATGIVASENTVSNYSSSPFRFPGTSNSTLLIEYKAIIAFSYGGHRYIVVGGKSLRPRQGQEVRVIFNRDAPQTACEPSTSGLIDYLALGIAFPVWFVCFLLIMGAAAYNKNFHPTNINLTGIRQGGLMQRVNFSAFAF